jgi:glycosyltransferase involved in cell wall biosynthesis
LRILVLFDGISGVSFHRLYTPYARLQLDYEDVTVDISQNQNEWADLPYEKYDCVVFNRWLGKLQYNILPILAKKKVPFICDNDDYWVIPRHNPAYQFYRAYLKNGVKDAIYYADAIQVTTEQLKHQCVEINPKVHIVPNCIDPIQHQWRQVVPHPPTIGWLGGISHLEDLKLLSGQIKPICEKYGYRFLMCGFHENVKIWAEMEKAITGESRRNRPDWFHTREGTRADIYGMYYAEMDIALAPLTKSKFNRYKSELKILEAAAYKLPIVCSAVEPYTNHRSNLGVFFVENNDWTTPLTKLIESGKSKQIGEINHNYCNEHHDIKKVNETRYNLLKSLCK